MVNLHGAVDQYLEGALTFPELIQVVTSHYLDAQAVAAASCLTCGSDLTARIPHVASPLESSPDAAAEWDLDAQLAEHQRKIEADRVLRGGR